MWQMQKYNPKLKAQHRFKVLDETGFIWDLKKWSWNKKIEGLKEYKEKHKNLIVPRNHKVIGMWVYLQRVEYRKFVSGKKSQLTQVEIDELDSLGFIWDSMECHWEKKTSRIEKV
mmetsp:Transcript_16736/g.37634  ORF Transcript_16736/g.37634 Transcript_16736/m.37634 type:complete len:115 (-) Transcript_16736:400-744(-)